VCDTQGEEIIGILHVKDLLAKQYLKAIHESQDLKPLLRPVMLIPETTQLNHVLQEFRRSHTHIAIVVNEYGGVAGLVTIEDVLEQIVGEIEDEYDTEEQHIREINHHVFMVSGVTPIDVFNQQFGLQLSEEECDTIGGYVIQMLGHLPRKNEQFRIEGLQIKVLSADQKTVKWLQVQGEQRS
jgi:magnesium and cobalt transporter